MCNGLRKFKDDDSRTNHSILKYISRQGPASKGVGFLECKKSEKEYGTESALHVSDRSRWCAVIKLMESLGIETDYALPDNQAALAMIQERVARQKAQA